ncbi:MAG TPA: flagellar hook-basal body complex protein FliE [Planctomycetota bacterium]|nr:flagellar hook-basal body complex protein FliE [Planctomycetota bacterium]
MLENIGSNVGPVKGPAGPGPAAQAGPAEGERSFKEILKDSIASVNSLQQEADQVLEKFTKGEATEDQVMIAFKKSQIAFETLMQMRNKLVDAFEEIQRMRI